MMKSKKPSKTSNNTPNMSYGEIDDMNFDKNSENSDVSINTDLKVFNGGVSKLIKNANRKHQVGVGMGIDVGLMNKKNISTQLKNKNNESNNIYMNFKRKKCDLNTKNLKIGSYGVYLENGVVNNKNTDNSYNSNNSSKSNNYSDGVCNTGAFKPSAPGSPVSFRNQITNNKLDFNVSNVKNKIIEENVNCDNDSDRGSVYSKKSNSSNRSRKEKKTYSDPMEKNLVLIDKSGKGNNGNRDNVNYITNHNNNNNNNPPLSSNKYTGKINEKELFYGNNVKILSSSDADNEYSDFPVSTDSIGNVNSNSDLFTKIKEMSNSNSNNNSNSNSNNTSTNSKSNSNFTITSNNSKKVSMTYSKVANGLAILVGSDDKIFTMPASYLPKSSVPGNIYQITIEEVVRADQKVNSIRQMQKKYIKNKK
jgi:hypothetical protein